MRVYPRCAMPAGTRARTTGNCLSCVSRAFMSEPNRRAHFVVSPTDDILTILIFATRTECQIAVNGLNTGCVRFRAYDLLGASLTCCACMECSKNDIDNSLRGEHVPTAHGRSTRGRQQRTLRYFYCHEKVGDEHPHESP